MIPSQGRVLVDFYADWCGPCQVVGRALDQIDLVPVVKVNLDDNLELAALHGVRNVPTLIIFDDGEEITRRTGAMSKSELEAWIRG